MLRTFQIPLVSKKTKNNFQRYIGCLSFINDLIQYVLLLILVHARQLNCFTAVIPHLIKYCETIYERDGINLFWSIKRSNEVLNKFKSTGFKDSTLSTYDFSTQYTTLPHHLIKDKHIDLIERTFSREKTLYKLACNKERAFFISDVYKYYKLWSCRNV